MGIFTPPISGSDWGYFFNCTLRFINAPPVPTLRFDILRQIAQRALDDRKERAIPFDSR
jgi:hypothetical protein